MRRKHSNDRQELIGGFEWQQKFIRLVSPVNAKQSFVKRDNVSIRPKQLLN
jgi:hypothetical protein